MTQGSVGTSGYIQSDSVKAYQKDYYERNKEKILKRRKLALIQKNKNKEYHDSITPHPPPLK